jgi:hypothetical protein
MTGSRHHKASMVRKDHCTQRLLLHPLADVQSVGHFKEAIHLHHPCFRQVPAQAQNLSIPPLFVCAANGHAARGGWLVALTRVRGAPWRVMR